ncbi:MAG TPA: SMP-30/gluconolactonase/LRE family protein [Spirochaetia bacterium]|nr:SMP-30/gluconolactonase/LRE family protein [Spirochaetia bacterium]
MADWEIYDRRFRDLTLPTVKLEKLYSGALWAEGPVWFSDTQCLLFSDIPNDRILRWVDGAPVTVFRSPSGFANGNTRDVQGRLLTCEHGSRRVTRTEPDGRITVIADGYAGGRLNSPNDVVVARDGAVWFTDPQYGILSDYEGHKAPSEQKGAYVYRVDASSSTVTVAADDLGKPNGLAFSPDQETLYIADSAASHDDSAPHHVRRFRVTGGGLRGGEVFAEIEPGVPDGLRTDTEGNVWISCANGILCFSPGGERLGKILVPDTVANLTFGGPKRNRLFITAQGSLYALYVNARGAQEP